MRVLGLDYGSARCGCALSDPTGTIVTPIDPVARPASRRGLAAIARLVDEREVERVVVGLPLSLNGGDSEQTRETSEFAATIDTRLGDRVPV
jgi:putative Holliday junction resolvase